MKLINKILLVKPDKKITHTEGGLELPDVAQEKPTKGILLEFDEQIELPFLKKGMIVHYPDFAGTIFGENILLRLEEVWGFEQQV